DYVVNLLFYLINGGGSHNQIRKYFKRGVIFYTLTKMKNEWGINSQHNGQSKNSHLIRKTFKDYFFQSNFVLSFLRGSKWCVIIIGREECFAIKNCSR